jgi:hypothetical protein
VRTPVQEATAPSDVPKGNSQQPNPLAARLARHAGCLGGRVAIVLAILIGPLTSWTVIRAFHVDTADVFLGMVNTIAIILTLGAVLSLPPFIASTAARVVVSYAHSPEYPLLCVTALSDGEIVTGYVLAILRHVRALLILMLGLAPVFGMMVAYVVWLVNVFDYPPMTWYDGVLATADLGMFGIVLKHILITTALSLGLLGINLLATALGVGFGLWWRSATPASIAALMTTVGSTLVISCMVAKVVGSLEIPDDFTRHLLQCMLFAPFPYLLALGCMRLARRWARGPG